MATLSTINPTLADIAKMTAPDGKIAKIIEVMQQTNELLDDMVWIEGNLPTGHRTTSRSGLPTPTWRRLNYGVQPTKETSIQVTDNCGMLEDYAEVDKALADLNGNTPAFRLRSDKAHIQGMMHEVAKTVFYGNETTTPEMFTGLSPRFSTRNVATAASARNVIHGGGAGATNTSIWLVVWGESMVHGIYPKGSQSGLQHQDKGQVTIENADGNGGRMEAYRSHYKWDCGLSVPDWRYAVRIANIDVSTLTSDGATGAKLFDLMAQASERVESLSTGKAAFYCNRTVREWMRLQAANHKNVRLTQEQVAGRRVLMVDEVPVRRCDALLNTEATVPNT